MHEVEIKTTLNETVTFF